MTNNTDHKDFTRFSRRSFLVGTGTIALASTLPVGQASAQTATVPRRYIRRDLSDPLAPLRSYRRAITAMLALPPSDPRNWYRNAFVHTLDCPHGNWWFLPWHRGYIGWFEKTCRQLSGDPNFALPFWDWTQQPRIPQVFFQGVLNPSNSLFISSYEKFKAEFQNPLSDFWNSLSPQQLNQLSLRGYNSLNDVWASVEQGMFFPANQARSLTPENPNFNRQTRRAVSQATIKDALAPADFINFGSGIAPQLSSSSTQGVLESQPHNNVHNNVGGFMGDFLSPVDPIFFMHHSNIDRLWDVWTRKQEQQGLPTLPKDDLDKWQKEPFLFFIDNNGQPVTANKAGDYATIGDFNYVYQGGFNPSPVSARRRVSPNVESFSGEVTARALNFSALSSGNVNLPNATLRSAITEDDLRTVVAEITIQPPADVHDVTFNVLVNTPKGQRNIDFNSPHFAGTFVFFGKPHHPGPVTFSIPLTSALKALAKQGKLDIDQPIEINVVPDSKGITLRALGATPESVSLESIKIKVF